MTSILKVATVILMLKNKTFIIVAVVALVLILGGGGFFLLSKRSAPSADTASSNQSSEQQVLTMKPEDIGLTLTRTTYTKKSPPGPALHMEITKLNGVKSVDCEIHYSHATDTGERTTEGLLCNLEVKSDMSTISQDFPFATCSDVCHYQKDIKDVEAIIKVSKDDGKTYQVDQKLTDQ